VCRLISSRLGIIGEPLSQFDAETLKPIGQEAEDEDSINAPALQSSQLGFPKSSSDEKEYAISSLCCQFNVHSFDLS
jgi:hypothetical protein